MPWIFPLHYLITHCPAQGIIDRPIGHYGCSQLRLKLKDLNNLKVHQYGHVHGVTNYLFINKQSIIDRIKDEQNRELPKNNKPWFYLFITNNNNNNIDDYVLFINAVNDGIEQPMFMYYPVQIK